MNMNEELALEETPRDSFLGDPLFGNPKRNASSLGEAFWDRDEDHSGESPNFFYTI